MPNYEDIKWVQGTSGKTKIVKCRFQDQEDAGTTPEDENGIESRGGAAAGEAEAAPPHLQGGVFSCSCGCCCGWSPQPIWKGGGKGTEG